MGEKEFHVLIKHCFLMERNTVQAKQGLNKCYPDSVPTPTTVKRSYADLKRGRTDTNDAELSGRANSAVVPENVKKVHKIDYRKLCKIAEYWKIS
ncbi:ABC transporter domain-containing protein [Trichonephila clavipes]|nr:ABC transporter domain-containing protein [Trichonephila clavipes]